MIFDYETIFNIWARNLLIPYSLSYLLVSEKELKKLNDLDNDDKKTQKDILDHIKKNSRIKLKCIKGYNCNEIFFKDIINLQKDKVENKWL